MLWLVLVTLLAGSVHSARLHAQEAEPATASEHTLFLPSINHSGQKPSAFSGHGEWPGGRTYLVQAEDTLLSVALEMGVDPEEMNCLLSPTFTWAQPLVIGDTLTVPETPFACHRVEAGETLPAIAAAYGVDPEIIRTEPWNQLTSGDLRDGQNLRIPFVVAAPAPVARPLVNAWTTGQGGQYPTLPDVLEKDVPADWPYGSGRFAWPTYGWITQGYGTGHSGLDIAAPAGTLVTSADRGVVIRAGWSSVGYGQFVVIDHNIDYITLYAHLSEIYVEEGQVVGKGQLLGRIGSTGNSTGPHLHFEIRDFGYRIDPLHLLPH